MKDTRDKLSNYQIMMLIPSAIIGVIVLTLPRLAAEDALAGGIISVAVGGFLSAMTLAFIALIGRKFPQSTVMEYSRVVLGNILGFGFGILIVFYSILATGVVLRSFADALKIILLPNTPLEVIMICMLIAVILLVLNGISAIARISESFVPIIVVALSLLIFLNYQDFDFIKLMPVFSEGITPIVLSIPGLFLAFLGYEIAYFFCPFMANQKKVVILSLIGIAIPFVLYLALVFISIGTFGPETTGNLVYPTITLARKIIFPGGFAERFDILFVLLWILAAYTSITISYYISALSVTRLFGLRNYKPFIYIILPIIYIIAILPQNIFQIEQLSQYTGWLGGFIVLSSIPLLIISIIRKKRGDSGA